VLRSWNGAGPNEGGVATALSADGSVVLMDSSSTNLLYNYTPGYTTLYVFDPTP